MKKKIKPTSVRLDKDLLEEVDQRCDKVGCSRNNFIKNSVEFAITQTSDFDFGDDEEMDETKEEPEKPEILSNLNVELGKVYDEDGNVVGTIRKR